jgi:hypothetical protein
MKNRLIIIYFRIGVDALGFPLTWKHTVHQYENYHAFGSAYKQSVNQ